MKYYCVLDFEATCQPDTEGVILNQEIIEFPAILYKEDKGKLVKVSEFHKYVQPIFNPTLTKFCTTLTGITQQTVNSAYFFCTVWDEFKKWLKLHKGENAVFVTCGAWDLKTMLPKQLELSKEKNINACKQFINIKSEYAYNYNRKAEGLFGMLDHAGLGFIGRQHSGIDDTRNIARLFEYLYEEGHKDYQIIRLK